MIETPQQYTARMLSLVGDRDPLILMADAPNRLMALVDSATPQERAWTTSPDRWTISQITAHLADAEIVGAWRFRTVLAQDGAPLHAYDQNTWASAFHYERTPVEEAVSVFAALRHATLGLLDRVDPARRRHAGIHTERGRESVEHLTRMFAGHDLNHLTQIEKLLREARATGR